MKFSEWKQWYRSLPWAFKIFIWLILLRPLIDGFYFLKEVSPFASPLYIAGLINFLLAFYCIFRFKKNFYNPIDTAYRLYFAALVLSLIMLVTRFNFSNNAVETAFKTLNPALTFFIARRLVNSDKDVDGVFKIFLYSALMVAILILVEIFIKPFKEISSRGIDRLEGAYADVLNYSIYLTLSMLIVCFMFLRKNTVSTKRSRWYLLITVIAFSIVALTRINHVATLAIFLGLIVLFLMFLFRTGIVQATLFIGTGFIVLQFFASDIIESNVMPLLKTDLEVYSGERDRSQAFHGRVGRWERLWENFSREPITGQILGMPYTMTEFSSQIVGGSHNDFLRILFLTGFIGLILYLFFVLQVFIQIRKFNTSYQFLLLGALSIVLLYSISTLPLLYMPLMNIIWVIYAMACLPEQLVRRYQ
jgi:O-antigen ligase